MLTKASLIEWAASWVPDVPMHSEFEPGQRARFVKALTEELKDWKEPPAKVVYCKHCPFAEHVHYGSDPYTGCPGFEPLP